MRFESVSALFLLLGFAPPHLTTRDAAAADLAFVRETEDGKREAFITTADGGERPLDEGAWSSYPASATRDGVLALLRTSEHGTELVVRGRAIAHAGFLREPTFAPDGRSLVVESDLGGFRDLVRVTIDGASTKLTHDPEGDFEPSFFPDGRTLAFTSSRDGQTEIYRLRIDDASSLTRLTHAPGEDFTPRVAPDGSQIAFLTGRSGVDRVWLMSPDGTNAQPLRDDAPDESEREHVWSPDGSKLAFVARAPNGKARVLLFDRTKRSVTPVTDGTTTSDMPAFSPDGRRLAFVMETLAKSPDLMVADADGTHAHRVFSEPARRWRPIFVPRPKQAEKD